MVITLCIPSEESVVRVLDRGQSAYLLTGVRQERGKSQNAILLTR